MFGDIAAVWYLLSAIVAIGMAAFLPKTRKPAPPPEMSDRAVDAIFDLMVEDLRLRDGGQP